MKFIIALLTIASAFSFNAQTTRTIGFYNVENLFDTIDGKHNDNDFLPTAKSKWNSEKYFTKINRINQVMDSMDSPMLIGFAEIENAEVVNDLMKHSKKRTNYGVVHFESIDDRGIDVALAYDPSVLTLIKSDKIRFLLDNPEHPHTRDILWAEFSLGNEKMIAVVNHWPSRRGGQVESEPNRIKAASLAKHFIDSTIAASPKTKIVFMGDLNDYPTDMSAKLIAESLTPMIEKSSGKYGGSYNYRGEWDVLDHILVSKNFFKGKNIKTVKNSGEIVSSEFILTEYKGDIVPKRNYAGDNYLDGYSDHLPVLMKVKVK